MAVPDDTCSECCTCPTPVIEHSVRSGTVNSVSRYRVVASGSIAASGDTNTISGTSQFSYDPATGLFTRSDDYQLHIETPTESCTFDFLPIGFSSDVLFFDGCDVENDGIFITADYDEQGCDSVYTFPGFSGDYRLTYSQQFSEAEVLGFLDARVSGRDYSLFGSGSVPAYFTFEASTQILTTDGCTMTAYQGTRQDVRYRFRFKIPQVGTGKNYRLTWVERFIPEAGVGLDSIEVISRGVYRPSVTLSAPPAGGIQARAVAVMSPAGGVSSIQILHPGSGYLAPPTVTVQAAINGGTTSTGWTATLTGGQVSDITGGSAGDYLPTLAFSSGGGSGATAAATMDAQGGIASVALAAPGSAYAAAPALILTPRVSGSTAADILLHLGTETPKSWQWASGDVPPGYDPATPSTWPVAGDNGNGYFDLPAPPLAGITSVANLRSVCLPGTGTSNIIPII